MKNFLLKSTLFILPLIIAQSNLAVLPEIPTITTSNTETPLKQINQPPLGLSHSVGSENPDIKMQASIQSITGASKSSLANRPDKLKNPTIDQPDISSQPICDKMDLVSKDSEIEALAKQFNINLDKQKSIECQLTSSFNLIQKDEAFARSLQWNEYPSRNIPVKTDTQFDRTADSNDIESKSKNGFGQNIPEEYFSPFLETKDSCFCCGHSKLIPTGTSMVFEDIFMTNCEKHHVKYQGERYVQMYHGTSSNQRKSLEEGIQGVGKGDLGAGFYVTADFKYALEHGYAKTQYNDDQEDYPIIIGILVPALELVKNFGQKPANDNVVIERHYNNAIRHKFVLRKGILNRLIANKIYLPAG